ncbi:NPH3 domain [Sesbania bispinosa]|nr:NPH3 domain [Sesbania bispinosa]
MKKRGAKYLTLAGALITYTERTLRDPLYLSSPSEKAAFPINFLCCFSRCAIYLRASAECKRELEKRITEILEHVTVDDLLVLSFTYDGERLLDLDSVRRIISGFMEKEKSTSVFSAGGNFREDFSAAMQRVAKTVDAYLAEIAAYGELTISKFNGSLFSSQKAREKSTTISTAPWISTSSVRARLLQARVHASQNKRLPVQTVLHALYYDQFKDKEGVAETGTWGRGHGGERNQLQMDVSLVRENEELRTELTKMKMFVSDLQKNVHGTASSGKDVSVSTKKPTFFSSMTKKLGKLNPFKNGSKDTSHIDDGPALDLTKPRRRRFSVS